MHMGRQHFREQHPGWARFLLLDGVLEQPTRGAPHAG